MKKIFIVGSAPLPFEEVKIRTAAGLRTWQFLHPLLAFSEAFSLHLVTIAEPSSYNRNGTSGNAPKSLDSRRHFEHTVFLKDDAKLLSSLQKLHDSFQPDIILSVNTYPSFLAAQLHSSAPFWADLNGWIMAEAQAQAFKMQTDDYLAHYYRMEQVILKRADKFSTVSKAQALALMGELATMGRMNHQTFGYSFVEAIANGTEWFDTDQDFSLVEAKQLLQKKFVSLQAIPQDGFCLLWVGGYNTWVDEEMLFHAVDKALGTHKNIYFISTGGQIAGLDNKTFARFKKLVEHSQHKDRYIFLGWVEQQDLSALYVFADVGLNVDRMCLETLTGARNRINEMMKFGLPVVSTLGSEIAQTMSDVGAGFGVQSGNVLAFTDALEKLFMDKKQEGSLLASFGAAGKKYIREECNYQTLNQPFIKWIQQPLPAPDRGFTINFNKTGHFKSAFRYLREQGFKRFLKKLRQVLWCF